MNTQELIREAQANELRREVERAYKLSQKNIGVAIAAGILMPILAYAYTGRWKAFFVMLGVAMVVGFFAAAGTSTEAAFNAGALIGMIVAPIDNALAISGSRETVGKT